VFDNIKRFWSRTGRQSETKVTQEVKHPTVIFIHGAGQSGLCWNYYISQLRPMKFINLRYDIETPFFDNLERLAYEIRNEDDIIFISHSLGGLYALHLYDRLKPKVLSSVSISSPFGGSLTADWARYIIPNYLLFKEIGIRSRPVRTGLGVDIDTLKWIQIVSTNGGVPWHKGHNDGVVSVASQYAHPQMRKIEMPLTHHESLVSPDVCLVLHEEIERNTKIT